MGARKIYNDEIIINQSKQVLKTDFNNIKTLQQLYSKVKEALSSTAVEIPTFVTFTRIIRDYLDMESNVRIKRSDLLRMACIDTDIENFSQLCKVLDETQITSINTNNLCFFIKVKPPFTAENIDYILKKRYHKEILATVYDSDTITVFAKDIHSKSKIIKAIVTSKKKLKNQPMHVNFEHYDKEKDLNYILGIDKKHNNESYNITYSKDDIKNIFILLLNLVATLDEDMPLTNVHEQLKEFAEPKQIRIPSFQTLKKMLQKELIKRKIIDDNYNKINLNLVKKLMPFYCDLCYCNLYIKDYSLIIINFKIDKLSDDILFENIKFLKKELLKHQHYDVLLLKESYPNALVVFLRNSTEQEQLLNKSFVNKMQLPRNV